MNQRQMRLALTDVEDNSQMSDEELDSIDERAKRVRARVSMNNAFPTHSHFFAVSSSLRDETSQPNDKNSATT